MHRSVATSTVFSIAIHGALLAVLVGVRFSTSEERPAVGVVEVEYFVVADRIDAGAAARIGSSAEALESALPSPRPEVEPLESAEAATAPAARPPTPAPAARPPAPAQPAEKPAAARDAEPPATPQRVEAPQPVKPMPGLRITTEAALPQAPSIAADPVAPPDLPQTPVVPTPVLHAAAVGVDAPQRNRFSDKIEELASDVEVSAAVEPVVFEHDGSEYTATFTRRPAADDMDLDRLIVAVSTESSGERRSTEMHFKRLAFSHFAQFVDRWDPAVQIHDDEIDGRFHSNSEIYIDTSRGIKPTFHGKVTTARGVSTSSSIGRFRRSDVFLGGIETRIRKIPLLSKRAAFPAVDEDADRIHRFADSARITFYRDGRYASQPLDGSAPRRIRRLSDRTTYLLAAEDAELYVSGIVDGRVLVHSPESIVIEGDLVYAADPASNAEADDFLGLAADKNVEVAEPDVTGPGDLEVHAAIYAKRRFVIRHYRAPGQATLSILGSVTAGSLTASEPRYRTKVRFDRRLENARPPGFPTTDRWELASWDGRWSAE